MKVYVFIFQLTNSPCHKISIPLVQQSPPAILTLETPPRRTTPLPSPRILNLTQSHTSSLPLQSPSQAQECAASSDLSLVSQLYLYRHRLCAYVTGINFALVLCCPAVLIEDMNVTFISNKWETAMTSQGHVTAALPKQAK